MPAVHVPAQLAAEAWPLIITAGHAPPPGAATAGAAMDLLDENAAPAARFNRSVLLAVLGL